MRVSSVAIRSLQASSEFKEASDDRIVNLDCLLRVILRLVKQLRTGPDLALDLCVELLEALMGTPEVAQTRVSTDTDKLQKRLVQVGATADGDAGAGEPLPFTRTDNSGAGEHLRLSSTSNNGELQTRLSSTSNNGAGEHLRLSSTCNNGELQTRLSSTSNNGELQTRLSSTGNNGAGEHLRLSSTSNNGELQTRLSSTSNNGGAGELQTRLSPTSNDGLSSAGLSESISRFARTTSSGMFSERADDACNHSTNDMKLSQQQWWQQKKQPDPELSPISSSTEAPATRSCWNNIQLFPPASEGSIRRRIFLMMEEASTVVGRIVSVLVTLVILVSVVSLLLESMQQFCERPVECAARIAAGLPATVLACEPVPVSTFETVELVCLIVFVLEYGIRILTVHAGSATISEGLKQTWTYALQPFNVVDLLAILPSIVKLSLRGPEMRRNVFVRIMRMFRVLRLFKLAKHSGGMRMFAEVLVMSGQPLLILVFFNAIIVMVVGAVIHFAEGQRFSVEPKILEAHPTGAFVRVGMDSQDEATPFRSILYAIWWVCITMTTVGYGDFAPTTGLGRIIGVACFYIGVLLIALPVNVLGSNFELVYSKYLDDQRVLSESKSPEKVKKATTLAAFTRKRTAVPQLPFWEQPWFPDDGSIRRKVFLFFEHPGSCRLAKACSILVFGTIMLVTVSFVMESMPAFRSTSPDCPSDITVTNCEPKPWPIFGDLDRCGVVVFTVDYLCRVLTVHMASLEECGLTNEKHRGLPLRMTFAYCLLWMNVLDLLAILPFYIGLMFPGLNGGGASVLRVFRLIRVFRMLKMPKLSAGVTMFANVVADSMPALLMLFFLTLLGCVFFASMITFAEGSRYSVDHFKEEYPHGLYIRPTTDGYGVEPTPFLSVMDSFWWFFVTANTVGYGDLFPTTAAGRAIGIMTCYAGILLIALPITIIGGNFGKYYDEWVEAMGVSKTQSFQSSGHLDRQSSMGSIGRVTLRDSKASWGESRKEPQATNNESKKKGNKERETTPVLLVNVVPASSSSTC